MSKESAMRPLISLVAVGMALIASPAVAQPIRIPLSPQTQEQPPPPPSPVPVAPPQAEASVGPNASSPAEGRTPNLPAAQAPLGEEPTAPVPAGQGENGSAPGR